MPVMEGPDQDPRELSRLGLIELAAAEGHDADIPSNMGSIDRPGTGGSSSAKEKEMDVEKGHGSSRTSLDVASEPEEAAHDPDIVEFTKDDTGNPMNWSGSRRWGSVALVSFITLLTPLGSSMFAPGVPQLMEEFGSTSTLLAGFVVSIYVLGFAFGPLGRVPPLLASII